MPESLILPARLTDKVLIRSTIHESYWRAHGCGLTNSIDEAHRYSRAEAESFAGPLLGTVIEEISKMTETLITLRRQPPLITLRRQPPKLADDDVVLIRILASGRYWLSPGNGLTNSIDEAHRYPGREVGELLQRLRLVDVAEFIRVPEGD